MDRRRGIPPNALSEEDIEEQFETYFEENIETTIEDLAEAIEILAGIILEG